MKLADERRRAAEESANKTLAYHEKNPEKHPLYPEEWKKFWNRRYKEIQTGEFSGLVYSGNIYEINYSIYE